jgi:transcription termination factor Rho
MHVFEDVALPADEVQSVQCQFNSIATRSIIGYVFTIPNRVAILITADPVPYVIPADIVARNFLSTGDKVTANIAFSEMYNRYLVTEIKTVNNSAQLPRQYSTHYHEMATVPPSKEFMVDGKTLHIGHCVLVEVDRNENTDQRKAHIISQCPKDTIRVELLIDGRTEDDHALTPGVHYRHRTQITQNIQRKVMVCLTAFFHTAELAENGADVILLIDSFERMFDVYNGGVSLERISPLALSEFEFIIRSAKVLASGGSITVIGLHSKNTTAHYTLLHDRICQICDNII